MNKERKGRFNDVISSLEEAEGRSGGHLKRRTRLLRFPSRWFANVFQRRKDAGLHRLDGGLHK